MSGQHIGGTKLHVNDLERSITFYKDVVGMHDVARYEFEEQGLVEVLMSFEPAAVEPQAVGPWLILVERADNPGPHDIGNGFDRMMLMVDDVDAVCERLRAFGCEITVEPTDFPEFPARLSMVKDPDGYELELLQLPED